MKFSLFLFFPFCVFASTIGYVVQEGTGAVRTFNTQSAFPGVAIPLGATPKQICLSPDGSCLYAVFPSLDTILAIDSSTYETLFEIVVEDPASIYFSSEGKGYAVACDALYALNTQDASLEGPIASFCGYGSRKVVLSPDARCAYIALTDQICCIDLEAEVALQLPLEGEFSDLALTPNGSLLCVVYPSSPTLFFVIEVATKKILHTISFEEVGKGASAIVTTHDSKTAYLVAEQEDSLLEIDLETGTLQRVISVGTSPKHAALSPDGATIFVANSSSGDVTPVLVDTGTTLPAIAFGDSCTAIAVANVDLVQDLQVETIKSRFLVGDAVINTLSWKSAPGARTQSFRVWKNGRFFREVPAQEVMLIEDRRIQSGEQVVYSVVAVSASGTPSRPFAIEVP
ncbi:MAG: beta-propeller fold lactonase family protein [Chlamydiota bacterium]